jgi:Ricin-type beta-trefoil lectin domain-like
MEAISNPFNNPFGYGRYPHLKSDHRNILRFNQIPGAVFRLFIPYTLVCGASKMCLDVQSASLDVGAPLWQCSPNGTDAQSFRFEDAGNGFFYIRTLAGMYVTANPPRRIDRGPKGTGHIKQDVKYEASPMVPKSPDLQRWKLTSSSIVAINQSSYTISCAAYPGKVLQPAGGSTASGVAVVLGDPATTHSPMVIPNSWSVTSPLLPHSGLVNA